MLLRFSLKLDVSTHFVVPQDQTEWNQKAHHKTSQGWTPVRERATFQTWGKSLHPITPEANALSDWYGIYIFAADVPEPTLYVGIASNDSVASEGVLTRLKKHRVKATGSHVGATLNSSGGVHHPENWRDFATKRYIAIGGPGDALADVRIMVSKFDGMSLQTKADLERFEGALVRNERGALDAIVNKLWPGKNVAHIKLLNGNASRLQLYPDDQIELW